MLINFLRALDYMSAFSIGFYLTLLASLALVFVIFKYRTPGHNIKAGVNEEITVAYTILINGVISFSIICIGEIICFQNQRLLI